MYTEDRHDPGLSVVDQPKVSYVTEGDAQSESHQLCISGFCHRILSNHS